MDSGCACVRVCVCVHVWAPIQLLLEQMAGWYSYIFQFQSMQFESGRISNNGEWLYTPLEYITLIALYPHALLSLNVN